MLEKHLRSVAVGGIKRDADTGRSVKLTSAGNKGLLELLDDLPRRERGVLFRVDSVQQNRELVPTHPCDGVGLAHSVTKAFRDSLKQLVAYGVPKAVVD